jgi:hypothetical protein
VFVYHCQEGYCSGVGAGVGSAASVGAALSPVPERLLLREEIPVNNRQSECYHAAYGAASAAAAAAGVSLFIMDCIIRAYVCATERSAFM